MPGLCLGPGGQRLLYQSSQVQNAITDLGTALATMACCLEPPLESAESLNWLRFTKYSGVNSNNSKNFWWLKWGLVAYAVIWTMDVIDWWNCSVEKDMTCANIDKQILLLWMLWKISRYIALRVHFNAFSILLARQGQMLNIVVPCVWVFWSCFHMASRYISIKWDNNWIFIWDLQKYQWADQWRSPRSFILPHLFPSQPWYTSPRIEVFYFFLIFLKRKPMAIQDNYVSLTSSVPRDIACSGFYMKLTGQAQQHRHHRQTLWLVRRSAPRLFWILMGAGCLLERNHAPLLRSGTQVSLP